MERELMHSLLYDQLRLMPVPIDYDVHSDHCLISDVKEFEFNSSDVLIDVGVASSNKQPPSPKSALMTDRARQIRYPDPNDKEEILRSLGLDSLPSKEQLNEVIEQHWLTPKDSLPAHWLGRYQM